MEDCESSPPFVFQNFPFRMTKILIDNYGKKYYYLTHKKMKDTVEDDLMSVIDRIKALSSDDCTYDTFSGNADGVDSNVKFIIETDPIE